MTPYSDIYGVFLAKITDYSYLQLEETQVEEILRPYLVSAISKFKKYSKLNLDDRMDMIEQFNITLGDEEIEILASQMVVEYLKPQIVNLELIKQNLSNKEWKTYSQANQLKEMRLLRNEMKLEVEELIMNYSYNDTMGDLI